MTEEDEEDEGGGGGGGGGGGRKRRKQNGGKSDINLAGIPLRTMELFTFACDTEIGLNYIYLQLKLID